MAKRMLVDATQPEETRVVVVNGNRLEDLDFEIASRKQLKGNIYLAKVTRVEPSLQAAFIEYGGNRHGFLAFSEIHPDYYRIPVADREALLAEERRLAELADEDEDEAPRSRGRDRDRGRGQGRGGSSRYAESDSGRNGDAAESHDAGEPAFQADEASDESDDREDGPETEGDAGVAERDGGESEPDSGAQSADRSEDPDESGTVMAAAIPVESVSDETASADDGEPGDGDESADAPDFGSEGVAGESESHDGYQGHDETESHEAPEPVRLDTVGGDETDDEEMARRRPRPLRSYKIQEVIKRRQILLVQVTKEERGTKGAALTTYLSLPGRYCVLMPNTGRGGGVSRKITNPQDRKRLKEMLSDLDIPQGMAVILRTAGLERSKAEIKRDLEYLLRLWDSIREQTLQSTAPELIYEEANLIKRSIRDLYANDIDEVLVEGETGYRVAKDFMRMLVPSHSKRVQPYRDEAIPLFYRYQVESQIDAMHSPVVQLKSGGYIVINQTEALVAIDVNSGRSTRERNIEETAYKTNLEAADEVARQLRLRDLAGLIVIDFIDMEDNRNNASVERRMKEAMKNDRARIQLGRISPFGLLELSRQRLRPSLLEANFEKCPHCAGLGVIRSTESAALHALRAIEEEGIRRRSSEISVALPAKIALYILNAKRAELGLIEQRYGLRVLIQTDETLVVPDLRIERVKARLPGEEAAAAVATASALAEPERRTVAVDPDDDDTEEESPVAAEPRRGAPAEAASPERAGEGDGDRRGGRRGRRGRRRHGGERPGEGVPGPAAPMAAASAPESDDGDEAGDTGAVDEAASGVPSAPGAAENGDGQNRKRRRGKRGGRRRGRGRFEQNGAEGQTSEAAQSEEFASGEFASEDLESDDFDGDAEDGVDGDGDDRDVVPMPSGVAAGPVVVVPPAPVDEVVDFDWLLDVERPAETVASAEAVPSIADGEAVVASTEGEELATGGEELATGRGVLATALAVTETPPPETPAPTGARKRPSRRRTAAAAEPAVSADSVEPAAEPVAAAPAKRPSRRRTKSAVTEEALAPAELSVEVAPETAVEIVPEPAPEPVAEIVAADEDVVAVAPTERPEALPPAPAVIVTEPSEPAGPPKRGWWRK